MKNSVFLFLFICLLAVDAVAQDVELQWIGDAPKNAVGVSWGVPFEKGKVKEGQGFGLTNGLNEHVPLQSWVLAYHGDGSVKWMGFAAALLPGDKSAGLKVSLVASAAPEPKGVITREDDNIIRVNNGLAEFVFGKTGGDFLREIKVDNRVVAENGRLVCVLEDRTGDASGNVLSYEHFSGEIKKVTLEQKGPVRATIKIEGVHKSIKGTREWLPFVVRLYIYDGVEAVKMVHTVVFDGDQERDFMKGLGVSFDVPLREEMQNRHVCFSGADGGIWAEPVQPLNGRMPVMNVNNANAVPLPAVQLAGGRLPDKEQLSAQGKFLLDNLAAWDDYSLAQLSPDGFTIRKRTGDGSSPVGTAGGTRSSGLAFAGDVSGGFAVSLKNFWQSYPSEMEINNMRSDRATVHVWMWSPKSAAMDLRHYDTVGHTLNAAYEDYQEGLATPYGVARTSELMLFPLRAVPSRQSAATLAAEAQGINQLTASPKYLHDARAFGVWSLPDTSNPVKKWIEEQMNRYFAYYETAVDQHKWYGFWNYGDVMHSYNEGRHSWNYDMGGYAWDNTELATDLWLWYGFVRSGRADIYRMAQAMTRHTSEVDMYHIGELAGLGSRHNVSHWGCGAKEARVGQAWWKRFYYYLTTDERVGDIMREAVDADYRMLALDPLRLAQPRDQFPTAQPARLRWGPDWIAFAGNWFTEWERTGNRKYLDKIRTGMDGLAAMPNGLYSGMGPLGYDPATGKITYEGERDWVDHRNHLANLMGGFEVMMEMYKETGHKKFDNVYLLYAKFYGLPSDDPYRDRKENVKYKNWWGHFSMPRLGAFASKELNEPYLAEVAWNELLKTAVGRDGKLRNLVEPRYVATPEVLNGVDESSGVSTNGAAQWNLNAIMMLELIESPLNPPQGGLSGTRNPGQGGLPSPQDSSARDVSRSGRRSRGVPAAIEDVNKVTDNTIDSLNRVKMLRPAAGSSRKGNNPVLFLVGNSTMRQGTRGNGDIGQWGWGFYMEDFFDTDKITVENQALGGMSSRSFYNVLWQDVLAAVRPGDYVFIEMGHNDNGPFDSGRARASMPGIGRDTIVVKVQATATQPEREETVYTFGGYLRKYIEDARAKGAYPVLVSMTPRNAWDDRGRIVRSEKRLFTQQIAEEQGVPFIDLTEITALKYEKFGKYKVNYMFYGDATHTSAFGAKENARSAVEGIRGNKDLAALAAYLKPVRPDLATGVRRKAGKPVVFTIGDSTVKNYEKDENDMWGWGSVLEQYFDTTKTVVDNQAIAGRSARTYLDEGRWDRVYNALQPGDIVFMQFGHNDGGPIGTPPARGELRGAGDSSRVVVMSATRRNQVVYTYGWYIRKFCGDAIEKGAIPVVLSHTPRNDWTPDGRVVRNTNTYGIWAKEAAEAMGAYFIDLNRISGDKLEKMGKEKAAEYFKNDHTHSSLTGAHLNAQSIVEGVRALGVERIEGLLLKEAK